MVPADAREYCECIGHNGPELHEARLHPVPLSHCTEVEDMTEKRYRLSNKKDRVVNYELYVDSIIMKWRERGTFSGLTIMDHIGESASTGNYDKAIEALTKIRARCKMPEIRRMYDEGISDCKNIKKVMASVPANPEVAGVDKPESV